MHVNLRVIIATIAVAVATSSLSLLAPPLLSLVPTDTAYAQEGPSIEIEFSPHYMVRDNEELNFTITFSGISGLTSLTYDVSVATFGKPNVSVCEDTGVGIGNNMALGAFTGDTATATGTIPAKCPPYRYALVVKLYDSSGEKPDELVTAASAFKVAEFKELELPAGNRPTTPAGIWSEELSDYTLRFHVVDSSNSKVYVYHLPDGEGGSRGDSLTFVETYNLPGTTNPWGIGSPFGSTSSTTWVTNDGAGSGDKVFAYSRANSVQRDSGLDFTLASTNTAPRGIEPFVVMDDFTYFYVVDSDADRVFQYEWHGTSTRYLSEEDYLLHEDNADPTGLWLTGWQMFVADSDDDKIFAYEMTRTTTRMPLYDINDLDRVGNSDPAGITSDFRWIYVLDSADKMIYAYEYPEIPFKPVTVHGKSEIEVAENSTTTGEIYYAMDPNPDVNNGGATNTMASLGLYHLQSDDRYFYIVPLEDGYFELVFRDPNRRYYEDPNYEGPKGRDPNYENPKDRDPTDNVYELIISGGSRGFPHAYFPVSVTITDVQPEKPYFWQTTTSRDVAENVPVGHWIRPPIEAVNPDNEDTHIYSLSGTGSTSFDINSSGHLITKESLDASSTSTYSVTVSIRDNEGETASSTSTDIDDEIAVTINVFEGPVVSGLSSKNYAEHGTGDVAEFTATNPGGGTVEWSLEGDDAGDFTIASTTDGATLRFATSPDYENPVDDDPDNIYEITVVARDGSLRGDLAVTVTVTDENDAPVFSDGSSTSRNVDEGDQAGRPIGAPVTASDQDTSDTLFYSLSGTDAASFDIDSLTGQIKTDDDLDFEGKQEYSVTVEVRDSRDADGNVDTDTDDSIAVTINVLGVNDPPVLTGSSTVDYLENGAGPVATYTATDPEDEQITWGLSGSDEDAFTIAGGVLRFVTPPDYDDDDYYFVIIEASDGTSTSTLDVSVYIENVDEPPVVTGDATPEFAENDTGNVATYTAVDPEGVAVDWSLSGADADDLDIAGGALYFSDPPNYEVQNTYHVTVQAFDGTSTSTLPVVVTVTDVNEDPEFPTATANRSVEENSGENAVVGLPVAADDPDSDDTLTYILSGTGAASFTIASNGQIKTVSSLDGDTQDTYYVTVNVHDGKADDGSVSTTTDAYIDVTITVTDINEPPTLTGTTTTQYPENGTRAVATYTATDPEGLTPAWSLADTNNDDFEITGGVLTFKSPPNYEDTNAYQVTVKASDGNNTPELGVTITIVDLNEKPTFPSSENGQRTVEENTPADQNLGLPVATTDPDSSDTLTYILGGTDASSFDINSSNGQILTKDALDEDTKASYSVTVSVRDSRDDSGEPDGAVDDTITVTITVTGVNEPPVVTGTTTTEYPENGTRLVETYTATDEENDEIRWSLSGVDEDDFSITQFGDLEFDSAPDFEAPTDAGNDNGYSVTVLAADGTSTTTYTVTVTVTDVNEDPAFPDTEDGERSVDENTPAGRNIGDPVKATDPDHGDTLTYILDSISAELFDIDWSTGQLKTKSLLDAESQATYNVDVYVHDSKDADGSPSTTTDATMYVTITVEDVNEVPVVSGATTTEYAENGTASVATYTADDPESDNISWSPLGADGGAFTMSASGALSFRNPPNFETKDEYSVKVNAFDGKLTGTLDVTITITDENEPPDVTGRTAITFVETATGPVETFQANDPEDRAITWGVSGTSSDDFTISEGELNFAETPVYQIGQDNVYVITVQATDDANQSDTLDVKVIVTDENQVPEFPGDTTTRDVSENTAPDQNVGAPVRADDPENDYLTYSLIGTDARHFDIATSTGQILTKSADLNYESNKKSYTVTVRVTDNKNADGNADPTIDDTIEVTINVIDENEAPEISGATTTSWIENATGTVETYRATDPEGATTTWSVHGTDAAHFGITEDGDLYLETVPDYEHKSFYQVRVQASDGGNIADLDVTITITNVDEDGTVTLSPSQPVVGTHVNADLTDPDLVASITSWSWARSPDKTNWDLIIGETGSGYTPVDADEGNYLQATAYYVDGHGPAKTAPGVSDSQVPTTNSQPSFSPNIVRSVDENTGPGEPIGHPVTARNDEIDDTLVYTLGGDDAASFDIDTSNGQLKTKAELDFETTPSYSVTVSVSDGKDVNNNNDPSPDAVIDVTITVNNVNEAPVVTDDEAVDFAENATRTVATFTAEDPEKDAVSWDLSGDDVIAFNIEDGVLTFKSPPDFETKSTYQVTVAATDGRKTGTLEVTVNVSNVEEPGAVTLLPGHPLVGTQLTATLTDPDGGLASITWTWETSDGNTWTPVKTGTAGNSTSDSYTATSTDEGKSLRVGASYTDGDGPDKEAQTTSASDVGPKPIVNTAPDFAPSATREVPENTAAGQNVGEPVTATDTDAHDAGKLTYTLGGTDASSFDIESTTGQILTSDPLDREIKDTYTVTVTATDSSGLEDAITVTITVDDVDEPPTLDGPQTVTYNENNSGVVATYTVSDPENGRVTLEPKGDDGGHFRITGGQLFFNAHPDYEAPLDSDTDNVYILNLEASDGNSTTTLPVTVTVTKVNEPPQFPNGDSGTRSVTENTAAGQNVGRPVSASDPEKDDLHYTLSGRDARYFDIDSSTGQILAKAELNYEGRSSYSVKVSVRDSKNVDGNPDAVTDDTIDITITVIGENEAPVITGATSTNFAENSTRAVAFYTGRDPEGSTVTWTLLETDSAYFAITNSGVLSFDPVPDFEDEKDLDGNSVYHVTVQASDGNNISRLDMTVTVTNVEEAGTVELSSVQPQVDTPLTATLDDPDEIVSSVAWSWQRSAAGRKSNWSIINNATSDSYTPVTGDVGRYLRVTASYDDGYSNGKSASAISENTVRVVPQNNNPPRFLTQFTSRTVDENTAAGSDIGDPVTAIDDLNDRVTYKLGGTDGAMFRIVASTGQLQTRMPLDFESKTSYSARVTAADPSNATSSIRVNITVTNIDEPPVAVDDTATTTEDGSAITIDVLANDRDPEGMELTLAATTQPANGSAAVENNEVKYTPNSGYYGSDTFTYTVSDGENSSVANVFVRVDADGDPTVELGAIPIQFVPIDGGGERILLSDYFSDPDEGHPPYQATTSDSAIATVEVSEGYLTITPVGIGVATTTLTVSDTPGIRQEFRVVVYRPVVERTETETVHIVDPTIETTLTSKHGSLSVIFQAGARDQFFQAAIDAQSNNCGVEAPIGHQHLCVLVDLFDLGAQSIEESLNLPATLHVTLDQTLYSSIQADIDSGDFMMWKGHGPTDVSWDQIPQCGNPVGQDECYNLIADVNGGGKITVYNIMGFSEFAAGLDQSVPPPSTGGGGGGSTGGGSGGSTGGGSGGSSGGGSGSGGSGGSGSSGGSSSGGRSSSSSSYSSRSLDPSIEGERSVSYEENGTGPVSRYTVDYPREDDIVWALLGYDRKKFEISSTGVLSFRQPPDYENPTGREDNTYWLIIEATDDRRSNRYDVLHVRVNVTPVNELGSIVGDSEFSVAEDQTGAIAQYQIDDPEDGAIAWTLSGPDASTFAIDEQGNLLPAESLDFETTSSSAGDNVHKLTITATDNGEPEASAQLDVSVTISNVNEAPRVGDIPGVDLSTRHMPWMLDLGEFFTDPDGDALNFEISGWPGTDVANAAVDGRTLSITPAGEGTVSIFVVAADPGGLRAVGKVAVSVTAPAPAPTPVPVKVTVPEPVSTPAPVTVVKPVPTPSVPEPAPVVAPEPEPTFVPLGLLSERRYRNLEQQPDALSQVIVAFAIEPVHAPRADVVLPPMATPAPPEKVSAVDAVAASHGQAPLSASLDGSGGGLPTWLIMLLTLIAMVTAGYAVRMYVIHRL